MMTRPRSLPSFGDAMRTAASRVRRGYLRFLPAILWMGPGLPTAWRMTAAPGALARVSAPYLLGDALRMPTRSDREGPR
jgi:hypothetical protein